MSSTQRPLGLAYGGDQSGVHGDDGDGDHHGDHGDVLRRCCHCFHFLTTHCCGYPRAPLSGALLNDGCHGVPLSYHDVTRVRMGQPGSRR